MVLLSTATLQIWQYKFRITCGFETDFLKTVISSFEYFTESSRGSIQVATHSKITKLKVTILDQKFEKSKKTTKFGKIDKISKNRQNWEKSKKSLKNRQKLENRLNLEKSIKKWKNRQNLEKPTKF